MSHSKQYLVLVIAKRFCFNYSSICACVHWNLNLYIEESERRQNNTKTNHLKCIFNANSVFEICSEENVKWRKQDFLWNEKKNQIKSRVEHMFVFFFSSQLSIVWNIILSQERMKPLEIFYHTFGIFTSFRMRFGMKQLWHCKHHSNPI